LQHQNVNIQNSKSNKKSRLRLDVLAAEKRSFGEGEKNYFYLKGSLVYKLLVLRNTAQELTL
jgi:hypothetical protein